MRRDRVSPPTLASDREKGATVPRHQRTARSEWVSCRVVGSRRAARKWQSLAPIRPYSRARQDAAAGSRQLAAGQFQRAHRRLSGSRRDPRRTEMTERGSSTLPADRRQQSIGVSPRVRASTHVASSLSRSRSRRRQLDSRRAQRRTPTPQLRATPPTPAGRRAAVAPPILAGRTGRNGHAARGTRDESTRVEHPRASRTHQQRWRGRS